MKAWRKGSKVSAFKRAAISKRQICGMSAFWGGERFPNRGWQPNQVYPGKSSKVALSNNSQTIVLSFEMGGEFFHISDHFSIAKGKFQFSSICTTTTFRMWSKLRSSRGFWHHIQLVGGFLKWWVSPTNPWGFPTKKDHFGVFWGYHHLRKHPVCSFRRPKKSKRWSYTKYCEVQHPIFSHWNLRQERQQVLTSMFNAHVIYTLICHNSV